MCEQCKQSYSFKILAKWRKGLKIHFLAEICVLYIQLRNKQYLLRPYNIFGCWKYLIWKEINIFTKYIDLIVSPVSVCLFLCLCLCLSEWFLLNQVMNSCWTWFSFMFNKYVVILTKKKVWFLLKPFEIGFYMSFVRNSAFRECIEEVAKAKNHI